MFYSTGPISLTGAIIEALFSWRLRGKTETKTEGGNTERKFFWENGHINLLNTERKIREKATPSIYERAGGFIKALIYF